MKKLFTACFIGSLFFSSSSYSLPKLNSLSSASATIFLDFDGHVVEGTPWNYGQPLDCLAADLTDAQVTEIFNRVAEDFRPFEVNITTDSMVFLSAPLARRMRIIVTPTSAWYPNVGGVAFVGSFTMGTDLPAFVFPDKLGNKPKLIAECCSHESGHTLGLSHQAKYNGSCTLVAVYNNGTGSGETGWAPVMGNSYYKNFSGWNNGPTPSGCLADQDNLSIITSSNGFGYRKDDHADDHNLTSSISPGSDNTFNDSGLISTNTDKDFFKLNFSTNGRLNLHVRPFAVGPDNDGADLDVKVTLYDSSLNLLKVFDDSLTLHVAIDTVLTIGTYYVKVEGAGNTNTTNYGSLGSYTIDGLYIPLSVTAAKQVELSGNLTNENHKLTWKISETDLIQSIVLESSHDGTIFRTLSSFLIGSDAYEYTPLIKGNIYYRLKVNSQNGQYAYSNIVALKSAEKENNKFKISTFVHDYITIQASQNFKYQLVDASGRSIVSGNGKAGMNTIGINSRPNGVYFIQILSDEQRTTERIIRM